MEIVRYLIYYYSPVHPVIIKSQRFACLKLLDNVQSEPKLNSFKFLNNNFVIFIVLLYTLICDYSILFFYS
jgi:hypothetical protein